MNRCFVIGLFDTSSLFVFQTRLILVVPKFMGLQLMLKQDVLILRTLLSLRLVRHPSVINT